MIHSAAIWSAPRLPASRIVCRIATPSANEAGQLRQQRDLVERRVHKPQVVAIVETRDLEQQKDQRHVGQRREHHPVLTEHVQYHDQGHGSRRDVGDSEQPAMQRLAPHERGRSAPVNVYEADIASW